AAAPSVLRTPASAEVPLRCIPRTTMACRRCVERDEISASSCMPWISFMEPWLLLATGRDGGPCRCNAGKRVAGRKKANAHRRCAQMCGETGAHPIFVLGTNPQQAQHRRWEIGGGAVERADLATSTRHQSPLNLDAIIDDQVDRIADAADVC